MIRVAFILDSMGDGWLGGVNYYRNLFTAIESLPDRQIEPIVFAGKRTNLDFLPDCRCLRVVRSSVFDVDSLNLARVANKVLSTFFGKHFLRNRLLRKHGVAAISHVMHEASPKFKTLGWIPDFQHLHLPELFSRAELESRDAQFHALARTVDCVILSSNDARKDFERFAPEFAGKARVLKFVSVAARSDATLQPELQQRFGFSRPYFYVPNQFWAHKNHKIVVDALSLVKTKLSEILVLCTGAQQDHRNGLHFAELMADVKAKGLADNFRTLGVVPYSDVIGLMLGAVAVINPSRFEGWSTTVEEAKSLGVPMLLSDIPVHIEQAGKDAAFFDALNAHRLAEKMILLAGNDGRGHLAKPLSDDAVAGKSRLVRYGEAYQEIVLELMEGLHAS